MIQGIPYFGENNNELWKTIINTDITSTRFYKSIYKFMTEHIDRRVVAVVKDKYITWLNDIKFNYRDKQLYIPYYSYKEKYVPNKGYKTDNKGHIQLSEDFKQVILRYEYNYEKLIIRLNNFRLILFDLDTKEKYYAELSEYNWYNSDEFNIEELYQLYIDSCYEEDDFLINKHQGGYHFISKNIPNFENKERRLREIYGLPDYSENFIFDNDYRDVRQFKYDEVIQKEGFRSTLELYKIRRLRFEMLLYCIMQQGVKSSDISFNNQINQLGKTKHIVKYGNNIKLIFKDYWLGIKEEL